MVVRIVVEVHSAQTVRLREKLCAIGEELK
jgi:hypothetical protein